MKKLCALVFIILILMLIKKGYSIHARSKLNTTSKNNITENNILKKQLFDTNNYGDKSYQMNELSSDFFEELNGHDRMFGNTRKRSTDISEDLEHCVRNIWKSNDGQSYFGTFLELPNCEHNDKRRHRMKHLRHRIYHGMDEPHQNWHTTNQDDDYYDDISKDKSNPEEPINKNKDYDIEEDEEEKEDQCEKKLRPDEEEFNVEDDEDYFDTTIKNSKIFKKKQNKLKHKGKYHHGRNKKKQRKQYLTSIGENEKLVKKRDVVLSKVDTSQRSGIEIEEEGEREKVTVEHARLAQEIVNSIIKQTGPGRRKVLGICQKYLPQNFIDPTAELEEQRMIETVLQSVEESLMGVMSCHDCITLHPDLMAFLNWIVGGSSSQACCVPLDKMHLSKNYFLFDPHHHLGGQQCKQKIDILPNEKFLNEQHIPDTTCGIPRGTIASLNELEHRQLSHDYGKYDKEDYGNKPFHMPKENFGRISGPRKHYHNNIDSIDDDSSGQIEIPVDLEGSSDQEKINQ